MHVLLRLLVCAALVIGGVAPAASQPAPGLADFDPGRPATQTRVGRGETLYAIAERTRSPLIGLIRVNQLRPPFALTPGQILRLPPLKVHVVAKNETFAAIAKRYRVDERSLAVFNQLERPVRLSVGQRIILPALVRDQLTGLEPQDLVTLLTAELAAGHEVSGAVAGQIRAPKPAVTPPPVTKAPIPKVDALKAPKAPASTPPPAPKSVAAKAPPKIVPKPNEPPSQAIAEATPPPTSGTKPSFIWPVRGRLLETFGTKKDLRVVDGIEIEAPSGAPFRAAAPGTVVYVGNQLAGYGWLVLIRHSRDYMTAYAFANSVTVREGQTVTQGQVIGQVGQTGRAASPRLHFQVRHATKPINPVPLLAASTTSPT
jgi:murein DD-endopeptidase MepM/ murein hydrolase activator NlpD